MEWDESSDLGVPKTVTANFIFKDLYLEGEKKVETLHHFQNRIHSDPLTLPAKSLYLCTLSLLLLWGLDESQWETSDVYPNQPRNKFTVF